MPPLPTERLTARAIDLIYACAIDTSRWTDLPDRLAAIAGGAWALQVLQGDDPSKLAIHSANFDPEFLDTYRAHYASLNPWLPALCKSEPMRLVHDGEVLDRDRLLRSEFYADWIQPQGDIRCGTGMVLQAGDSGALILSCNYAPRHESQMADDAGRLITKIAPHLHRSLDLTRLAERHLGRRAADMLDAVGNGHASYALDTRSRLIQCDANGEALLRRGDTVVVSRDGRLRFQTSDANRALDDRLASGGIGDGGFVAGTSAGTRVLSRLVPLPIWERPDPVAEVVVPARAVAVLIVIDPRNMPELTGDNLRRLFDLTRAETFVATGLCDGLTVAEIADLRACSVNTVRNQLRSILAKTDTNRQAELVALIARHGL